MTRNFKTNSFTDDSDESDVGEDDEGEEQTEKIKRRKSVSEYEHDFKVWTLQVVKSKENNLNNLALYVCIGSTSNYGDLRLFFQNEMMKHVLK